MNELRRPSPSEFVARCRAANRPGQYMILPSDSRCGGNLAYLKDTNVQFLTSKRLGANFVQCELQIQPGGGTTKPIPHGKEHLLFLIEGSLEVALNGTRRELNRGGYAWIPPDQEFEFRNSSTSIDRLIWFRRRYTPLDGVLVPGPLFGNESEIPAIPEVDLNPEQQLIPYANLGYDVAFNIVVMKPGAYYGLVECHAWEHGMYMLEGEGLLWLGDGFHEVKAGDFIYMAPYCPEFFCALGWPENTVRFLLYWDGNRDYGQEL